MKIMLNLTEEQLFVITRALKHSSEKYSVFTGEANRDGTKELATALWKEHCKFADVLEYVEKTAKTN